MQQHPPSLACTLKHLVLFSPTLPYLKPQIAEALENSREMQHPQGSCTVNTLTHSSQTDNYVLK